MTENLELDEGLRIPEPEVPTKKKVRWYHVMTLGVAVLVCAAAVGFSVSQSSDHDDATKAREAAQTALVSQRADTKHARERLAGDRAEAKDALDKLAQVTTKLHELTDLAAQEIDAVNAAHRIGTTTPDDVDAYNEQIRRANALLPVMEAKAEEIQTLADQFRQDAEAQLAAVVR